MKTISIGAAALLFSVASAVAAPCNTGSTGKTGTVDPAAKNLAGGNQPASPGTVGAMNNAGANRGSPDQQASNTSTKTDSGKEDPAAKNLAGGNQPASPGTVGAMNNAEKTQTASSAKDDGC